MNTNKYFLNGSKESVETYKHSIAKAIETLSSSLNSNSIYSGEKAYELNKIARQFNISEKPQELDNIITNSLKEISKNSLNVNSPKSMAHLHCPVMIPSLVAETFISALNQSMDSWDQSPVATYVEQNTVNWLSSLIYKNHCSDSDGVFTSGGTQSNLMGLLLARDFYCEHFLKHDVFNKGLPNTANKFRILCTEKTHFSIHKSLSLLGLGKNCIEVIKINEKLQLDPSDLSKKIAELREDKLIPICLVTTVGDTDFGCIDNIKEIAEITNKNNIWLHADAAVGGALILSDKHSYRINGLELADSVTIDFHKLFFQPISCGAFLCKNKSKLSLINYHADYLNPDKDGFDVINLVDKSIQTTRRFDALKLTIALRCSGTKIFSEWIDHIIETTYKGIELVGNNQNLQLAYENQHITNSLNAIVFRYFDEHLDIEILNSVNSQIHKAIFHSGNFAIAQTKLNNQRYLKITLVNPTISLDLISQCLEQIILYGDLFKNKKGK